MWLLFWLLTKHFVADFLVQPPYMWKNKGTFLHPGGMLHAGLHAILTFIILLILVDRPVVAIIAYSEFIAHYFIDWAKMNLNEYFGWQCNTSEKFWWLLGLDQYLHSLCYLAILWYVYG